MSISSILAFFRRYKPSAEPDKAPARSLDVMVKVDDTPFIDLPAKPLAAVDEETRLKS